MINPTSTVRRTAVVVGVIYAAVLYLSGVHHDAGAKQALSYVPTALVILVALWDVWLWKAAWFHRLSQRPLISGTWSTTLTPTAESRIPEGGNRGPIEAYVVIRQTYWSIAVRQYTAESTSDSKASMWNNPKGGSARTLTFTYANQPRQVLEGRSRHHLGTTALDIVGMKPTTVTGDYFTDRYTKGDMTLTFVDRSTDHDSFATAQQHVQGAHVQGASDGDAEA